MNGMQLKTSGTPLSMYLPEDQQRLVKEMLFEQSDVFAREDADYVKNSLDRGWIRKSASSYSSPVVCVRKKDRSLRLCVDFQGMNRKTIPDHHPLPRIQDLLDTT